MFEVRLCAQSRVLDTKEPSTGRRIFAAGMGFLKGYSKLATLAFQAKRPLWAYKPKLHYFHHIILQLGNDSAAGRKSMNCLAYSCSQAEDFIGRTSLLSRRTAAKTGQKRTLQRYLAGALQIWRGERESARLLGP